MSMTTSSRTRLRVPPWSVAAAVAGALLFGAAAAPAADGETPSPTTSARGETTGVIGGLAVGAAAGGPFGAVLGAATGAWLGDRFDRERHARRSAEAALRASDSQRRLADAEIAELKDELALVTERDLLGRQIAAGADALATHVMFRTQETGLAATDIESLTRLGRVLAPLTAVQIRIEGYADPRGPAALNASLSRERAESVAAVLRAAGVPAGRLEVLGRGAVESSDAAPGSIGDNHALMRRATLTLTVPGTVVARR